jgi:hypothetical protein
MADLDGKKLKQVIDPTLAKAFTHPLRGHVWVTICEKGLLSPSAVAAELGLEIHDVNYHFRALAGRGLIRLARTKPGRRGFDEHFYEACTPGLDFDDAAWMEIPAPIRATLSADALRKIVDEMVEALGSGSFDARNRHLSHSWLVADERGWGEVMTGLRELLDLVLAVQERCAKDETGESKIPISIVLAAFETAAGMSPEKSESESP